MHTIRTFGVLSPFAGGDYYGAIIAAINRAAASDGNRIIAFQTLNPGSHSADYAGVPDFRWPVAWRHVDAIIILPGAVQASQARAIQRAGTPIVLVAHSLPEVDCAVVLSENRVGVRAAVAHLVEHGHHRIAFAANLRAFDCRERLQGYREGLAEHGALAGPELLIEAQDNQETGGEAVAEAVIRSKLAVTAIVMGTDRNAIGLMRRLTSAGFQLPRDLAVVGFDDIADTRYARPSLSTVRQPLDRIGAVAYQLARDEAAGLPGQRWTHQVDTQFVRRASCGCPAPDLQLSEAQLRAQFADTAYLQKTLNTQYDLGIELLGTPDHDARTLAWLRCTPALAGCLGLWSSDPDAVGVASEPGASETRADSPIKIVGEYHASGDPSVSMGAVMPISEFPPRWLFDLANGAADEAVFVVPVRNAVRDWGVLAAVGRIQDTTPPGRELVNHSGSLLVAALERRAMLRSLQEKEEIAVASAHYAGMAEIAINVLHNVGNILNSVNVSSATLQRAIGTSRVGRFGQAAAMVDEHARLGSDDLASFLTQDPRGKLIPAYLVQLSQVLQRENQDALAEVNRLTEHVRRIEQVIAAQQAHIGGRVFAQPAELSHVVDEVLAMRAAALDMGHIEVVKNYQPVAPVRVQRAKLVQVLDNLLQNAEEALCEQPNGHRRVTVDIGADATGAAYVRIRDNGEGIAEANLSRIFSYGFTTREDRAGFGLHYCATSMTEMGGRLMAKSEGPGRGSAFLLIFGQIAPRLQAKCGPG